MTLSILTFSIMTFSIMTFITTIKNTTPSRVIMLIVIYAKSNVCDIVMLSDIMLYVIMLNDVMLTRY
jgi:hypothetical protein